MKNYNKNFVKYVKINKYFYVLKDFMKKLFILMMNFFVFAASFCYEASGASNKPFFFNVPKVAENKMLKEARLIYLEAVKRGEFTSLVSFVDGTKIRKAPAWVNQSAAGCEFYLSPKYAARFSDKISFKFLVLHELSHCEAYNKPPLAFSWPSLSNYQNHLLSDLIYLEAAMMIDDERQNGYSIFQETYADIRAWALMIRSGTKPDDLMAFHDLRSGGFDRRHATYEVLPELGKFDWKNYDMEEFEEKVSFLTGQTLIGNFVCPTWLGGDACSLDFDWEVYWKSNTTQVFNQWLALKSQTDAALQVSQLRMLIIDAKANFLLPIPIWNHFSKIINENNFNFDNVDSVIASFRQQIYPFGLKSIDIRMINDTINKITQERRKKLLE